LFKSRLRSILNISPLPESKAESNVVAIRTGETLSDDTFPATPDAPEEGDYDLSPDNSNPSRLQAEDTAIREARNRIETEARARVTAEARARVEASARLAAEARIRAETAATEEARARTRAETLAAREAQARQELEAKLRQTVEDAVKAE